MTCRLCNLDKELQNSHIIHEFLYKPLYDDKHRAQRLSKIGEQQEYKKRKLLQKGLREKLLCFDCEQLLNDRYEKYFKQLWFDEKALPNKFGADTEIMLNGLDYGKFKLFHLSILFRASVSSLPEFEQVTLGAHEKSLRDMLINELRTRDGVCTPLQRLTVANANVWCLHSRVAGESTGSSLVITHLA